MIYQNKRFKEVDDMLTCDGCYFNHKHRTCYADTHPRIHNGELASCVLNETVYVKVEIDEVLSEL